MTTTLTGRFTSPPPSSPSAAVGRLAVLARRGGSCVRRLGTVGAGVLLALSGAVSLASSASAAQPTGPEPTLLIEYAPMGEWLVDERDAALRQALSMIPARFRELPMEIPEFGEVPMPVFDAMFAMLESPGRLAVTFDRSNEGASAFGAGVVFSAGPMPRERSAMVQGVVGGAIVDSGGADLVTASERFQGMSEMVSPVGLMRWGPRQSRDGWRYEFHAGSSPDPDAVFAALPPTPTFALRGFRPIVRGSLHLAPAEPAINFLRVMAGRGDPQAAQMIERIVDQSGLVGPDAVRVTFHSGFTPDAMVGYTVVERAGRHELTSGVGRDPLSPADLRMIPADAIVAGASRINKIQLRSQFSTMLEAPEAQDWLAQFEATTGVNLIDDVVASFGDVWGGYLSDSTGGGGLLSSVMFVKLADAAKFSDAAQSLNAFANAMAQNALPTPYVQGRTITRDGATFHTLGFPGLPIPLELTYAVASDWLILALSPQAAIAAAQQVADGARSILSNDAFGREVDADRGYVALTFVDSARTLRDGYGLATLATSAIANVVRSPHGAERDPGLILPTYAELARNIRPTVQRTYWRGDDLVQETTSDRSLLASSAAAVGAAAPAIQGLLPAAVAGAILPAFQRAQQTAIELRDEQMRREAQPAF